jgi:hypothetical protein
MRGFIFSGVVLSLSVPAFALQYNVENTGGTLSYTANVAHRLGKGQALLTTATGTTNSSVQAPAPSDVVDFNQNSWQLGGNFDDTRTATAVVTLDKIYEINKIHTLYTSYIPTTYDLRVSVDGENWTPIVTGGTPASFQVDTFATVQAKYIEWTAHGPGTLVSDVGTYMYMTELQAFVDAASSDIPQLEDGYNVIPAATVVAFSGTNLAPIFDEDVRSGNFAIPGTGGSRMLDLGAAIPIGTLKVDMFGGQTWASGLVEFSLDGMNFTPILDLGGIGDTIYNVPNHQVYTRYIRVSGTGGGAMIELGAFAKIPEPAALALAPLAMLLFRRHRQAA